MTTRLHFSNSLIFWIVIGWVGFALFPWYGVYDGFWGFEWWSDGYPIDQEYSPGLLQLVLHNVWILLPIGFLLLAPLSVITRPQNDSLFSKVLLTSGALGLAYILIQGFVVGPTGWSWEVFDQWFGVLEDGQYGMGYGALLVAGSFLFLLTQGLAAKGYIKGDIFVTGIVGLVICLVGLFIFFPVGKVLISALQDSEGLFAPVLFVEKFFSSDIWGLQCLSSHLNCGVAWNSLFLAVLVGASTTVLGLAFALLVTRTEIRAKRLLRVMSLLPVITPPFVVGLAVILLFGRSGSVTLFMESTFGIPASRWIYGLPGVWFSQLLAFTPIAFLVLIGVVEGVSPSMEEAAQTLRASRWETFKTVSLPLMKPGLANAFLLGFVESLADFGNPLILGGSYEVLSTQIFFSIVGAQSDQGMAAVLAMILLFFTLSAFYAQRRWLGKKSYATVTGKGDAGMHVHLPKRIEWLCYGTVIPWVVLTAVIYVMVMFGGFVQTWGYDHSFTLNHFKEAFEIQYSAEYGIQWMGAAWNSFWTTLEVATISAPITAILGLFTAYILVRQQFWGKDLFEFGTMLSFAVPGTVIGIGYILAFNVPPIEITGTAIILVVCFIFRNLPTGVRAGIASMSQLDKSLDEASLMLRASSFTTFNRIILPLMKPAIIAALVFSFARAMTAVSAVIFLVSADYDMATAYILGRVEDSNYGVAIAYSCVLILVILLAILLIQTVVGARKIGRRGSLNF